jgi:hypothetical protein
MARVLLLACGSLLFFALAVMSDGIESVAYLIGGWMLLAANCLLEAIGERQ